jgi:hypothetical protein
MGNHEERDADTTGNESSDEDMQYGTEDGSSTENIHDDEDDEDADDVVVRLLNNPLSHEDSATMRLTADEIQWAQQLKEIVERSPDLQNMNDLWIAQYALVSQGDLEEARRRIVATQTFQREFGVDHSLEQGLEMFAQLLEQQRGLLLSLDVDNVTMEGLHIMDQAKLNPNAALSSPQSWKVLMVGFYYYFYIVQPTIATVRIGHYTMSDFGNFDWHNLSMELSTCSNAEMLRLYPIKYTKFLAFNTNGIANIMFSLTKNIFPKSMIDSVQLGCRVPMTEDENVPRPLSEMYLQPSLEQSNERMRARARELLLLRAKNEAHFRI